VDRRATLNRISRHQTDNGLPDALAAASSSASSSTVVQTWILCSFFRSPRGGLPADRFGLAGSFDFDIVQTPTIGFAMYRNALTSVLWVDIMIHTGNDSGKFTSTPGE
jgi:hypothetical protein